MNKKNKKIDYSQMLREWKSCHKKLMNNKKWRKEIEKELIRLSKI